MRIKLDENFDVRLVPMLAAEGHEVDTVKSERLSGKPDDTIYDICRAERRVVLTLLPMLKTQPLKGKLWIVEPGRIRVYDPHEEGN